MKSSLIQCDWILPVVGAPIADAVVVVQGKRIAWLGERVALPDRYAAQPLRKINGVMLPGLVNAHTHLQYSGFHELGATQYQNFEHWCEDFEARYDAVSDPEYWAESSAAGAWQALRSGTTVFSDIITHDEARGAFARHGCAGIEFLEVIAALSQAWVDSERAAFLDRLSQQSTTVTGISPHAPYSVDPDVISDLVRIADEQGLRLHSHLAESSEEEAFYQRGAKAVLEIYGSLRDQFALVRSGGVSKNAAQFADSVGLLNKSTHVAHGIYLDKAQRDLLKDAGTRVALCPRSNATIGLAQAPVAAYLNEGHDISVGTDSLASAASLDLMEDVALLYSIARQQGYAGTDLAKRLLEAATAGGARALGLFEQGYGAIAEGGPADVAVFDLAATEETLESTIVEKAAGRCVLTMVAGEVVHDGAA